MNLSKGLIGEDNAGILGAFLVTKVQLAAMSRSDIPRVEDRRPFYLYVDEFQNFATDSFAVILSEARKYGLNLTVANQYVAQMTDSVRDAVFGNVGTTISFRVSADDAPVLVKQFEPTFEASDLLQLNNRHFIVSMIINGEKVPAFSATTLSIPKSPADNFDAIIKWSRENFARPRAEVENEIRETIEQSEKYKRELSDSGREAGEAGSWDSSFGAKTEQKPNFKFVPTPQGDFRRAKLSPNAAEGKESLGLRDLAKMVGEMDKPTAVEKKSGAKPEAKLETKSEAKKVPTEKRSTKKGDSKREKARRKGKIALSSPLLTPDKASGDATPVSTTVKIVQKEKPATKIQPSETFIDLSKPISDPAKFAGTDNSMDGFLSIKHGK